MIPYDEDPYFDEEYQKWLNAQNRDFVNEVEDVFKDDTIHLSTVPAPPKPQKSAPKKSDAMAYFGSQPIARPKPKPENAPILKVKPIGEQSKKVAEAVIPTGESFKSPPMEIIEDPDAFTILTYIPWADKTDIRVDINSYRIEIRVWPARPKDSIRYGFDRAIPMPSELSAEGATATLNNGTLVIVCPKMRIGGTGVYRLPEM